MSLMARFVQEYLIENHPGFAVVEIAGDLFIVNERRRDLDCESNFIPKNLTMLEAIAKVEMIIERLED